MTVEAMSCKHYECTNIHTDKHGGSAVGSNKHLFNVVFDSF